MFCCTDFFKICFLYVILVHLTQKNTSGMNFLFRINISNSSVIVIKFKLRIV